jgi:response regulator receiver domain-containing protein
MMAGVVLIVDDNEHLRSIAALTLRSHGYEILEASTGQEAIEKTLAKHPNLVLLDIDLPDMRGTEVARAIKRDPTTHKIPIIGWSALFWARFSTDCPGCRDGRLLRETCFAGIAPRNNCTIYGPFLTDSGCDGDTRL